MPRVTLHVSSKVKGQGYQRDKFCDQKISHYLRNRKEGLRLHKDKSWTVKSEKH